jgi:hypothetical protein
MKVFSNIPNLPIALVILSLLTFTTFISTKKTELSTDSVDFIQYDCMPSIPVFKATTLPTIAQVVSLSPNAETVFHRASS